MGFVTLLLLWTWRRVVAFVVPVVPSPTRRHYAEREDIGRRFTNPKIDDDGLVIADALIAGIVAPGFEALVSVASGVPPPSWALALGPKKLVAPVMIRGSNLAAAWLSGALAARLYERSSYDFPPPDGAKSRYRTTLLRCLQAGSFATAVLLLSTQLTVFGQYGFIRFGDDPTTDAVLLRIADDTLRDVATEGIVLLSWRITRTSLSYKDDLPSSR